MRKLFQGGLLLASGLVTRPVLSAPVEAYPGVLQSLEPSGYAVIIVCAIVFGIGMLMRFRKF